MTTVCAWCGRTLTESPNGGGWVSHALCADCAVDLEYSRIPLAEFLERLDGPVLAADQDVRLLGANQALCSTIACDPEGLIGRSGGEVLQCVHSTEGGGCGRTIHCSGCTIRRAVNRTRRTGVPAFNVPAFTYVKTPDGTAQLDLRVSTQMVGPVILLRVDALEVHPLDALETSPEPT